MDGNFFDPLISLLSAVGQIEKGCGLKVGVALVRGLVGSAQISSKKDR